MGIRRSLVAHLGVVVLASTLVPTFASPPASAQPSMRTVAAAMAVVEPVVAIAARGSCNAATGEWEVFWGFHTWTAGIAVSSARDEINRYVYPIPNPTWVRPGGDAIWLSHRLPGTATVAGLTVMFASPEGAAPTTRRLALPGVCEKQQAPACVAAENATYQHALDPTTGVATLEYVGAPPCSNPGLIYATHVVQPDGVLGRFAGIPVALGSWTGFFHTKTSMYVDQAPCAYRRHLYFGSPLTPPAPGAILGATEEPGNRSSGPVAEESEGSGACVAPTVRFASTRARKGPRTWVPAVQITVNNAAEAAVPAAFTVGYVSPAGAYISKVHQAAPGETLTVTVSAQESSLPVRVWVAFPLVFGPNPPGGFYMWRTPPVSLRRR